MTECTMEEAILDFFYCGVNPWIKDAGYRWITGDDAIIARKFIRFCYDASWALVTHTGDLCPPEPQHRNLPEDRETFDLFLTTSSFVDLLELWSFRNEIVGTRLESMIIEFCYVWINVQDGAPGKWTRTTVEMSDDIGSDDEHESNIPDANWARRTHDLY